jgi:hypothetical protein
MTSDRRVTIPIDRKMPFQYEQKNSIAGWASRDRDLRGNCRTSLWNDSRPASNSRKHIQARRRRIFRHLGISNHRLVAGRAEFNGYGFVARLLFQAGHPHRASILGLCLRNGGCEPIRAGSLVVAGYRRGANMDCQLYAGSFVIDRTSVVLIRRRAILPAVAGFSRSARICVQQQARHRDVLFGPRRACGNAYPAATFAVARP